MRDQALTSTLSNTRCTDLFVEVPSSLLALTWASGHRCSVTPAAPSHTSDVSEQWTRYALQPGICTVASLPQVTATSATVHYGSMSLGLCD